MKHLDLVRTVEQRDTERLTVVTETHNGWTRGWVARIQLSQPGAKYDLDREFIGADDESLSYGGNGRRFYYDLQDGIYEAESVYQSMRAFRVYFRVLGGDIVAVTRSKEAAKGWLCELGIGA